MTVEVRMPPGVDPEKMRRAASLEMARRFFIVFVRLTFPEYQAEGVHKYLAGKLQGFAEAVERREGPRLMLLVPPQHGKSELVARRFPPWVLGRHPDWNVILASYGAELAEELSGDARRVVLSEEYADIYGQRAALDPSETVEIERNRKSVSHWRLAGHRGGLRAVGVGGAITGRSADILIVDDPVKGRAEADSAAERERTWQWWPQARDRVQKGGGMIVCMTPWHHDDLRGRLLKLAEQDPDADQWQVVALPAVAEANDVLGRTEEEALAPKRYDAADLRTLKAVVGPREWSAKFMLRPTDDEGALFKREWWKQENPAFGRTKFKVLFGDLAFSRNRAADYSVLGLWSVEPGPVWRLLEVERGRWTLPDSRAAANRLHERHKLRLAVIEKKGQTDEVFKEWKSGLNCPVLWYTPTTDKLNRAHAATPYVANGTVVLPEHAPWLADFLDELGRFPVGEHDDQVDMLTMSVNVLANGLRLPKKVQVFDFRVVA